MRCVPKHKNSKKDIDLPPPPLHMQTINTLTPGFQKKVRAGLQRHFILLGERSEKYGFDDIDLQLVDLQTNTAIAIYTGREEDQEAYYFEREDFKFFTK